MNDSISSRLSGDVGREDMKVIATFRSANDSIKIDGSKITHDTNYITERRKIIEELCKLDNARPAGLMRLKHKFGDDQTSQHHLKSIYQSKTYDYVKPKKEMDPSYNLVKNVESFEARGSSTASGTPFTKDKWTATSRIN